MKYTQFEQKVVDTFNRMHFIESCDDTFCIEFADADVQTILAESFKAKFNIVYDREYTTTRKALIEMFEADEDAILIEALNSYNDIMNKYNVVAMSTNEYTLHII